MKTDVRGAMSAAELAIAGEAMFGKRWRLPLARALGCHSSYIHQFLNGTRYINPELAGVVRNLAYLSPAGAVILDRMKVVTPEIEHRLAFRVAKLAAQSLSDKGLLASNEEIPAVIDGRVGWRRRDRLRNPKAS